MEQTKAQHIITFGSNEEISEEVLQNLYHKQAVFITHNELFLKRIKKLSLPSSPPVIWAVPDIAYPDSREIKAIIGLFTHIKKIKVEQDIHSLSREIKKASEERPLVFVLTPERFLNNMSSAFFYQLKELLPPTTHYIFLPTREPQEQLILLSPENRTWFTFTPPYSFVNICEVSITSSKENQILSINQESPDEFLAKYRINSQALSNFCFVKQKGDRYIPYIIKRLFDNTIETHTEINPGKYIFAYAYANTFISFLEETCDRPDIPTNGIFVLISTPLSYNLLEKEKNRLFHAIKKHNIGESIAIGCKFFLDLFSLPEKNSAGMIICRW